MDTLHEHLNPFLRENYQRVNPQRTTQPCGESSFINPSPSETIFIHVKFSDVIICLILSSCLSLLSKHLVTLFLFPDSPTGVIHETYFHVSLINLNDRERQSSKFYINFFQASQRKTIHLKTINIRNGNAMMNLKQQTHVEMKN